MHRANPSFQPLRLSGQVARRASVDSREFTGAYDPLPSMLGLTGRSNSRLASAVRHKGFRRNMQFMLSDQCAGVCGLGRWCGKELSGARRVKLVHMASSSLALASKQLRERCCRVDGDG